MEITADFIKTKHTELQTKNRKVKEDYEYVSGKNPKIIHEDDKPKPDNRIPVPMAKTAVMTVVGYAGRPGDIVTEYEKIELDEEETEESEYQKLINEYAIHNEEHLENSELLHNALSYGAGWELWWIVDKDGETLPEYKIVSPQEACPVFSKTLKPELEAFIRFWEDDKTTYADVYYPLYSERWEKKDVDVEFTDTGETTEYPYERVPAIEFTANANKKPIYEAEKPLIDSYDSAISKSQNEVDRFNAAILMLPAFLDALSKKEMREGESAIFDNLEQFDKWPEYLQKNLSGINEFYNNHSKNLERLFHKSIGIPDISDENFAGNQSGVAIAYKLIPLEFLVSQVEAYFRRGLMARKEMYDDFFAVFHPGIDAEDYKPIVTWKRNMPVDEVAKVQSAGILSSLISPEALLNWMPNTIVPVVDDELDRLGLNVEVGEDDIAEVTAGIGEDNVELSGIQIRSAREVIQAIVDGITPREAGINQLMAFLGLSREVAEAVIGNPQVKKKDANPTIPSEE